MILNVSLEKIFPGRGRGDIIYSWKQFRFRIITSIVMTVINILKLFRVLVIITT